MNILIVSQYFWPENFRINDLALGLLERGNRVTVLTGNPNYPEGRFFPGYGNFKKIHENYCGIEIMRVPILPRGAGGGTRLVLNYLSFALSASILAPFLCKGTFDLIFVFEPSPITVCLPALLLKKIKSIPLLLWVQDLWPESISATGAIRSQKILQLVEKLVRFIYQGCDRILVTSRAYISPIERVGADTKRILYFPQTAEELYQPVDVELNAAERAHIPNAFNVMFAGNIGAAQDFGTILSAAKILRNYPDIHWIIIGDGRLRPWVENQISERGLKDRVHLLGRHPVETMPVFFSLADVMLVTLKKDPIFSLTIPAKLQSYLACARPIIAVLDGEGSHLIRESGAGLSCPAEDANALADAVLTMRQMPKSERENMGKHGRVYYEKNFARNMLIDRLESWMHGLTKTV